MAVDKQTPYLPSHPAQVQVRRIRLGIQEWVFQALVICAVLSDGATLKCGTGRFYPSKTITEVEGESVESCQLDFSFHIGGCEGSTIELDGIFSYETAGCLPSVLHADGSHKMTCYCSSDLCNLDIPSIYGLAKDSINKSQDNGTSTAATCILEILRVAFDYPTTTSTTTTTTSTTTIITSTTSSRRYQPRPTESIDLDDESGDGQRAESASPTSTSEPVVKEDLPGWVYAVVSIGAVGVLVAVRLLVWRWTKRNKRAVPSKISVEKAVSPKKDCVITKTITKTPTSRKRPGPMRAGSTKHFHKVAPVTMCEGAGRKGDEPLRHALEGDKSSSIKGPVMIDPAQCVLAKMGSEFDLIGSQKASKVNDENGGDFKVVVAKPKKKMVKKAVGDKKSTKEGKGKSLMKGLELGETGKTQASGQEETGIGEDGTQTD